MDDLLSKQEYNALIDIFRFVASILIIGSHSLPIFYSDTLNFYYGQWFFRFCVPFFMIVTGYYFSRCDYHKKVKQIKRILLMYIISTAIYFPFIIATNAGVINVIKTSIFGYHHLWYLIAVVIGLLLCMLFSKLPDKYNLYTAVTLLLLGLILDEYHSLVNYPPLEMISSFVDKFLGGARNGVFFAFPVLFFGKLISDYDAKLKALSYKILCLLLACTFILGFAETHIILNTIGSKATLDVSFFGWMPAIPLFVLSMKTSTIKYKKTFVIMRKASMIIYIIHPWFLWGLNKLGFTHYSKFIVCTFISIAFSVVAVIGFQYFKNRRALKYPTPVK